MSNNSLSMEVIKGKYHSMETFSTVDGPGVRVVVFMQGCPLRCIYCQNPDSLKFEDGTTITTSEIFDQVKAQKSFITPNNGGLTASGGEPLAQPEFVSSLFKRVQKELQITTAIDTSGCVPLTPSVQEVLSYTNYVLVDIKHTNPAKHVVLTGRSLGMIKDFIDYIQTRAHIKIWIRHVVVPGYTTDDDDVHSIAKYIASISQVERIDLLPYHSMGEHKWELLKKEYKLKDIIPPSKEDIEHIAQIMHQYGISPKSIFLNES